MTPRIKALQAEVQRPNLKPSLKKLYQIQLEKEIKEYEDKAAKAKAHAASVVETIASGNDRAIDRLAEAEFGQDYEVSQFQEYWRVDSHVAGEQHAGFYDFATYHEAQNKRRWLMNQRLYDKYVRSGELDSLSKLN